MRNVFVIFFFFNSNSDISIEAEQIIQGLLQLNAERRLTATKVRQRLERLIKSKTSSSDRIVPDARKATRLDNNPDQPKRTFKSRNPTKVTNYIQEQQIIYSILL